SNFQESALAGGVSVVDFWAEWCGPCRLIGPIIEDLATEYEGKATIGKVNVDDNPEVSLKYGVRSIPTILIIKDGEVVDKQLNLLSIAFIIQIIEKRVSATLAAPCFEDLTPLEEINKYKE
ncbi:unnamed protein product, partial [Darwinula stevensoni]